VRQEDPLGASTSFAYDVLGRQTSVTNALGETSAAQFDSLGRLVRTHSSERGIQVMTYYDDGNLKSTTDSRGITVSYTYDSLGRPTDIIYPNDDDIHFEYDDMTHNAIGKLSTVTQGQDGIAYFYDPQHGRTTRTEQTIDGTSYSILYEYNDAGLLAKMTLPNGLETEYEYDSMKRPVRLHGSALGGEITTSYTARGKTSIITYPNGVQTSYAYNDNNLVSAISTSSAQDELFAETYVYDDGALTKGEITQIFSGMNQASPGDDEGLSLVGQYTYDALGRLRTADYSPLGSLCGVWAACSDQTYSYDALGNMLDLNGMTMHYENPASASILSSDETYEYRYDSQGNMVAKKKTFSGLETTYIYNDAGKLTKVVFPGGRQIAYRYDPNGRRVQTIEPKVKTNYVYDSVGQMIYQESMPR
ncbi:MAG: hypothetical protein ABIH41_02325, partial [Nanoarchaeota archaeon]